ncbi:unnamed protein product, partial [Candidula unifasciata]
RRSLQCVAGDAQIYGELVLENIHFVRTLRGRGVRSSEVSEAKFQARAGRLLLQWSMIGALIMKDLTLNNARCFCTSTFLHVLKMTLDEYILLVVETQTDKHKDAQLQKNLQKHMKNTEEIKMSAKVRTQANKIQTSPKVRKRKLPAPPESEGEYELDATDTEEHCTSYTQAPPLPSHYESMTSTAFSWPTQPAHRDTVVVNNVSSSLATQCRSMLRPSAISSNSVPLSPVKHFPPYDRSAYIPTFSFNTYNDYVSHTNTFATPRPVQPFSDHTASQAFHSVNFNPGVNPASSAPPGYWTEVRPHQAGLSDAYTQLAYPSYQHTYDSYKKNPFLRSTMYQDSFGRSSSTFDGLSRANAALDGLARSNSTLDSFARPSPSFDAGRSAMYYTPDSIQVGPYGNSFMEITPPSGQYPRQDGLLYQEDMLASNMAAATGLPGFSKSYLPAGFR